jgi:hypothetical protein
MRRTSLLVALVATISCQDQGVEPVPFDGEGTVAFAAGGIPLHADVDFGSPDGAVGSDFAPGHDQSGHASDKVRPRMTLIRAGGSVTFTLYPIHQAAVYAPGVGPEDIDTSEVEQIPVLPFLTRITDDTNRIALSPGQAFGVQTWTTPEGTFDEPGMYLVICTTTVHFVDLDMYSWVLVK